MSSLQLLQKCGPARLTAKPTAARRFSRVACDSSLRSRGCDQRNRSTLNAPFTELNAYYGRSKARLTVTRASSSDVSPSSPHLQLGTAKLPQKVSVSAFSEIIYQWAAGLTQSGSNLPFASPLRADKTQNGFKIDFLGRLPDGGFAPVAILVASVEAESAGNILYIRLYEGSAAWSTALVSDQIPPVGSPERLEKLLNSQPDIKLIMQTFPAAIRKAVSYAQ